MSIASASAGDALPPLYSAWLAQWLDGPLPVESEAACDRCVMCAAPGAPDDAVLAFDPSIKCCTYIPALPSFLVGRILAADDPAAASGRDTVLRRLRARIAVTPLGLGRSPRDSLLYQHSAAAFGRNRTLRCPHYLEERGACGVWQHRNAICATWFCKHSRGAAGARFWRHAIERLLGAAERALVGHCALSLDLGTPALERLFPATAPSAALDGEALDGRVDESHYRALWGRWHGREEEFYVACARIVEGLDFAAVLELGGAELKIAAALAREGYRLLDAGALPEALQVGRLELSRVTPDASVVSTYSPFDPLEISSDLMRALPYFDGRPTADAERAIARSEGIAIDRALLRRLVDFEVLIPAASLGARRKRN